MFFNPAAILFFLSLLLFQRLFSRPKHPHISEDLEFVKLWLLQSPKILELTLPSLSRFASRLKNDPTGTFVAELRKDLAESDFYQHLCLKYLIGSVAVSGQADRDVLSLIREICRSSGGPRHLPELLDGLSEKNNCHAIVQFIAKHSGRLECAGPLKALVSELVRNEWGAVRPLIMRVLDVLREDQQAVRIFVLTYLPAERQCEMVNTGNISLCTLRAIHCHAKSTLSSRILFATARCSYHSSPQLRSCIAEMVPQFRQFLADSSVTSIVIPCPSHIPKLHDDAWIRIFTFLDFETLTFALPLVCNTWRKLRPQALADSATAHDFYLQDVCYFGLRSICTIAPWKSILLNTEIALRYLGCCISEGALSRIQINNALQEEVKKYLGAVTKDKLLLKIGNCASPYQPFIKLLEAICQSCTRSKLTFDKPVFFTDKEYEEAIRYIVCEKGRTLKLSESLIVNDMPKLFHIIGEDEELMKRLIAEYFIDFDEPSIILILHEQTGRVPDGLRRLIFSQAALFRSFMVPKLVNPSEYFDVIVDCGILPQLIVNHYELPQLHRLVILFVLFFRDNPVKTDKIVLLLLTLFLDPSNWELGNVKWVLETELSAALESSSEHSSEDVDFFKTTMRRCGLFDEWNAM